MAAVSSVEVPPSKSIILADSRFASSAIPMYYTLDETTSVSVVTTACDPANFETRLSANVSGTSISYNSMVWAHSTYTHTGTSADFRFSVWDGSQWLGPYVMYHRPYEIFRSFTGVDRTLADNYVQGVEGSYVRDWEEGLNNDIRLASANTVSVGPITVGGNPVLWAVRYSDCNGIKITASNTADAEDANITWRMERCGSLEIAHNVHGFGVLEQEGTNRYVPEWVFSGKDPASEASGKNIHLSDAIPALTPVINLDVYCPQISRDRRLQTFRNARMDKGLGNEIANLSVFKETLGSTVRAVTTREENVWNMRVGTEPDTFTFIVANSESGQALSSSTCFANMLNSFQPSSALIKQEWFLLSTSYRGGTDAMNLLLFNITAPVAGQVVPLTNAYGNPSSELLLSEIIHVLDVFMPY